jgi:hypothetical protein
LILRDFDSGIVFLTTVFLENILSARRRLTSFNSIKMEKPEGPTSGLKEEQPQTTGSSTAIVIF